MELSVCFPVHWRKGNLSTKAGIKFVVGPKSLKFAGGFPRIFYENAASKRNFACRSLIAYRGTTTEPMWLHFLACLNFFVMMVFQRDFERKEYVDITIDPFMGLNIKIHGFKFFFFYFTFQSL